jgi:dihydrolipoamide dehydrogenase
LLKKNNVTYAKGLGKFAS